MCLCTITKKYEKPVRRVVKAYKQFDHFGRGVPMEFMYRVLHDTYKLTLDEWLKAEEQPLQADDQQRYTSGFHGYTKRPAPDGCSSTLVWPVYQYEVTTEGIDSGLKVRVSRYLYVPSDPSAPAPKAPAAARAAKKGA